MVCEAGFNLQVLAVGDSFLKFLVRHYQSVLVDIAGRSFVSDAYNQVSIVGGVVLPLEGLMDAVLALAGVGGNLGLGHIFLAGFVEGVGLADGGGAGFHIGRVLWPPKGPGCLLCFYSL